MWRLIFLFCLVSNVVFSQNKITHVVYFDTDKYTIPETENFRLIEFLNRIDSIEIEKISIYGFCDDRGSHAYNLKLSQNRADAIKNAFSQNEFDESLITNTDGKGELLLTIIEDFDIAKIRGLNRKVEISVKPKPKPKKSKFKYRTIAHFLDDDLEVGDRILLKNLFFERGYSILVRESKPALNKIASTLKKRSDVHFRIEGHVCCTDGDNDAIDGKTKKRNLSQARAKYVFDYLTNKGINQKRMTYLGMQRKFPLGGPQKYDRRVEIVITKIE